MTAPIPDLIGMVHLLPLPGSPRFGGSMDEVVSVARDDAEMLLDAGFPALMVENFGDVPFHASAVPPVTVAAMSVVASELATLGAPLGINVLRNDARAALGVAVAVGAALIRVNVLAGTMFTDQGPITGDAAKVLRDRVVLGPDVAVWADVAVKHATPPPGSDVAQMAIDTVERGLADALVLSGAGTGSNLDLDEAKRVRAALPETTLVAGSGTTAENLDTTSGVIDKYIVGSSLKKDGLASNRPDPERVDKFLEAAQRHGLL